jgi:hypothetical protein
MAAGGVMLISDDAHHIAWPSPFKLGACEGCGMIAPAFYVERAGRHVD